MRRHLMALLLPVAVVLGGCQPHVTAQQTWQPATVPAEGFTVVRMDGAPTLWADGAQTVVEAPLGDSAGAHPLADGRIALASATAITIVDAHGRGPFTHTPRCHDGIGGVAAAGGGVALICARTDRGQMETVALFFDGNLQLVNEARLQVPMAHRGDVTPEADRLPQLLAAGPDAIWVSRIARDGYDRGGPQLIEKYGWDGQLIASSSVDGSVYQSAVAPDGSHLALLVGGSGGACFTYSSLRLVNLVTMQQLSTSPDTPLAALKDARTADDVHFRADDVEWMSDSTLTVVGVAKRDSSADPCDDGPDQRWERHYSIGRMGFVDVRIDAQESSATSAWIGPGCEDEIVMTDGQRYERRGAEGSVSLRDVDSILYAASPPEGC